MATRTQFGPLERIIDISFPKPLKVYWLWKHGPGSLSHDFPGDQKWIDHIPHGPDKTTIAPWLAGSNIFASSRNAIRAHSLATFCGIDPTTGKYTPPTAQHLHQELADFKIIDEMASTITGGFFLDKKEAVLFATNIFNKGWLWDDFAAKHSWPYNFTFLVSPAPAIFDLTLPDGGSLGHPEVICDLSPYGYLSKPKELFSSIQIWETNWPPKGTGPLNAAIPPVKLHTAKVLVDKSLGLDGENGGAPSKYAIFQGGTLEPNGSGFQTYKNAQDPSQGFTGTQITDFFNTKDEADQNVKIIQDAINAQRRLFMPVDKFPRDFKYQPKKVETITYQGGGKEDGIMKPLAQPHVCTHPPIVQVGTQVFSSVIDSCNQPVLSINLINGQITPGFEGPIGFDFKGLTKPNE